MNEERTNLVYLKMDRDFGLEFKRYCNLAGVDCHVFEDPCATDTYIAVYKTTDAIDKLLTAMFNDMYATVCLHAKEI